MTETKQTTTWTNGSKTALAVVIMIWFTTAYIIGSGQWLTNDQLWLIPPIAVTVAIPVLAFLAAYALSHRFRDFVLAQDIETLTMLQHWRVLGFSFLLLYFYGVLPGLFAWPAGLGDLAIGFAAPLIILRLRKDPAYATSAGLVRYHYLGLLDFAVAVVAVGLATGAYPALTPNGVTGAPMDVWPLNLFPSFGVPIFIILHLSVLLKVRELRRRGAIGFTTELKAA